jgi:hypothetical protein
MKGVFCDVMLPKCNVLIPFTVKRLPLKRMFSQINREG